MTARKLAEQDLLRRSQEMATLFSVANILAQTEHFEEKVAHVLETLAQISQADSVTLRVPDDNELGLKAVAAAGPAVQDSPTGVLSYTDSVSGTAYQHGEPVIVNDYTAHPLASPLGINRGVKSLAALPVKNAGQTIGLVIIYSRVPDFFTQERIRFLTTVVGGLGTLLDNARLYEELEYRAEELARSNAELEQFAYVASHDLQEPLRMVSSYVQILAEDYKGQLDENADRFIGYAVDGANRMKGLIDGLLAFSRVGTQGEPFEATDCNLILEQVINGLEETIEDSGASLSQERLPTVNADPIQLSQVFQNLISNALKFSGEGSPNVHISTEQRPEDWVFSVQDNGIGIAERHYERIFKMFQRLHHRSEYEGSGIGLALCHKIVQRHGGKIWVKSKVGEGATFYFSIPKAEMEGS
jgi:signal transduction histidine kinase